MALGNTAYVVCTEDYDSREALTLLQYNATIFNPAAMASIPALQYLASIFGVAESTFSYGEFAQVSFAALCFAVPLITLTRRWLSWVSRIVVRMECWFIKIAPSLNGLSRTIL